MVTGLSGGQMQVSHCSHVFEPKRGGCTCAVHNLPTYHIDKYIGHLILMTNMSLRKTIDQIQNQFKINHFKNTDFHHSLKFKIFNRWYDQSVVHVYVALNILCVQTKCKQCWLSILQLLTLFKFIWAYFASDSSSGDVRLPLLTLVRKKFVWGVASVGLSRVAPSSTFPWKHKQIFHCLKAFGATNCCFSVVHLSMEWTWHWQTFFQLI